MVSHNHIIGPSAEELSNFTGREWVFKAIDEWMAKADGARYFLVTGEPGSGKTAIADRLSQFSRNQVTLPSHAIRFTRSFLSAVHFCSARDSTRVDPLNFSRSVSLQLAKLYPEFNQALANSDDQSININVEQTIGNILGSGVVAGVLIENLILGGLKAQDVFNRIILDPLKYIYSKGFNQTIIILVDALDESLAHKGDLTIVDLLSTVSELPSQVKFILTSRPDARVENKFLEAEVLCISGADYDQYNYQDIRQYISFRFHHELPEKASALELKELTRIEEAITRKSEGNFLYTAFLLGSLAKGDRSFGDLDEVPSGLYGLYFVSLERIVRLGGKDWTKDYSTVLGALSVAQEGLTFAQLLAFTDQAEETVWASLVDLQQFIKRASLKDIPDEEVRYRLYHQSVIEFLRNRFFKYNEKELNNTYYLPPGSYHRKIARYFLDHYSGRWRECGEYGLRNLTKHLINSTKSLDELIEVLSDLRFIEAKCAAGMIYDLMADYRAGLEVIGEASDESTRDRINEFNSFVNEHAHILNVRPSLTFQQAINQPDSFSPAVVAKELGSTALESRAWLQWLNKQQYRGVCILTLTGHTSGIEACAFSPDGRRIVSSSWNHELKIWNTQTGAVLSTFVGHRDVVEDCDFSSDGHWIVSASRDETIRVWDTETGEEILRITDDEWVHQCSFSPDNRQILSASIGKVKLWDVQTGSLVLTRTGGIPCAFSPDGEQIVSTYGKRWKREILKVWKARTGTAVTTLQVHSDMARACAYSPDGSLVAAPSGKNALKIWDAKTGQEVITLKGHTDVIRDCAFSPDGRRIVSASDDKTLKVWDRQTGKILATLRGHSSLVKTCDYSPDGRRILSGSGDHTLKIWDVSAAMKEENSADGHQESVLDINFSPDGQRVISSSWDETLKVWETEEGAELTTLTGHSSPVGRCSYSPDGRRIISGSGDTTLKVWDSVSATEIATLSGHDWGVTNFALSPDATRCVSLAYDWNPEFWFGDWFLNLWDLVQFKLAARLEGHKFQIRHCAFSPDGRSVVSASSDGQLKIWDALTGEERFTLMKHNDMVSGCAYSTDGRHIISASWDKTLNIWDVETGELLRTLTAHADGINDFALSPDGSKAACAGGKVINIWNIRTEQLVARLVGHSDSVSACSFSPDGHFVLSRSEDDGIKLWNAETGEEVGAFYGNAHLTTMAIGKGGRYISAGDKLGGVYILRLHNFKLSHPIVTPVYIYQFRNHKWDEALTVKCEWCGRRFIPQAEVVEIIHSIGSSARPSPADPPYIALPPEAWDDPQLLSQCTYCHRTLKFNPFIVDNRDRY